MLTIELKNSGGKRIMKKLSKVVIATALIASMFTITAYAKPLHFYITKSNGVQMVQTNKKDRTDSKWLITNSNTSYSDFVENSDVIGFKVKDYTDYHIGNSMSSYHTFSRFVNNWPLSYTTVPIMRQDLALNAQIDSKGAYNYIHFEGAWYA